MTSQQHETFRRVGVVIVTWNSTTIINECLNALAAAAPRRELEVVVGDNSSADDTREVAATHPSRPIVSNTGRNAGYAAAINHAVAAMGEVDAILILNPDCRFEPGGLDRLADELAATGVGIVAPRLHESDGSLAFSIFRDATVLRGFGAALLGDRLAGRFPLLGEEETRDDEYTRTHDVDAASGAALLVSATCAADVGSWDEDYFLYSEETDYQRRARTRGHRVRFVHDAIATHEGGDSPVSPRLWSLLTVNRVQCFAKFNGPISTGLYRVSVLIGESLRALRGRKPSRAAVLALISPARRAALYPREKD